MIASRIQSRLRAIVPRSSPHFFWQCCTARLRLLPDDGTQKRIASRGEGISLAGAEKEVALGNTTSIYAWFLQLYKVFA